MNQQISLKDKQAMQAQAFAAGNFDLIFDLVELRASIAPMSPREIAKLAIEAFVATQANGGIKADCVAAAPAVKSHPELISDPKAAFSEQELKTMIADSVQFDYLVCLESGKKFSMLRRHLRESFGMSPADYRARWGLPADYPMTAPGYSQRKAEAAKGAGLGKHSRNSESMS